MYSMFQDVHLACGTYCSTPSSISLPGASLSQYCFEKIVWTQPQGHSGSVNHIWDVQRLVAAQEEPTSHQGEAVSLMLSPSLGSLCLQTCHSCLPPAAVPLAGSCFRLTLSLKGTSSVMISGVLCAPCATLIPLLFVSL